jgi:hypothetical protein
MAEADGRQQAADGRQQILDSRQEKGNNRDTHLVARYHVIPYFHLDKQKK